MKRKLIFLVIVLLNFTLAYADGPVADTKWKDISYDGFSAKIPDSSLQTWTDEDLNYSDEIRLKAFSARTGTGWYFAFGFNKRNAFPLGELLIFAAERKAAVSDIVIGNVPGKSLKFTESDMLRHEAFIFLVGERLFVFHAVNVPGDGSEAERFLASVRFEIDQSEIDSMPDNVLDNLVRTFFDLAGRDAASGDIEKSGAEAAAVPPPSGDVNKDSRGGVGTGSGSFGTGQNTNKANDLRVLFKQRPPYTELARQYNISGVVKLRVIFKADGTIGDISVTEAMPFGLTENAIWAARLMRFEPARRNGVAYSVRKVVHFNFLIY